MNFFLLDPLGNLDDERLGLVDDPPEGMDHDYTLTLGRKAGPYFPENATVYLWEEHPGMKLADILGNTNKYLIGSSLVKQIIEEHCPDTEIEYFPFTLYNHKKRVHSKDYFFINPIGGFDCLHEEACGIEYDSDGEVLTIERFILDPKKLADAPHLFRIDKEPAKYVISGRLKEAFAARGATNVVTEKLPVQESK